MIDLHVHILPGLDDGAETIEDALEMVALALESGVDRIVATPHSNQMGRFENFYSTRLKTAYEEVCRVLKEEKLPLRLDLGMEIYASTDVPDKLKNGQLIGLNGTGTCLMEFPFDADPGWIGEQLEEVVDMGVRPLIAHPERYFCVQDYPGFVYNWLQLGCLTQMNRGSIFGKFGRGAEFAANRLLENDLITCIASDAHSPYMRTTYMEDIWNYMEDSYGETAAYRLLQDNPKKILEGGPISPHGTIPEKRKYFFR